jgi:type I restriction enzyme, S subunit
MKIKHVPSSWLLSEGRRLDARPYLSGGREARELLKRLSVKKEPLHTLTQGHNGGIYNGPHFSRVYVDDPAYGVPFLGSGSMLEADLTRVPLLRKSDALSRKLSFLKLEEGTTLIACSGLANVGAATYVRADMAGMWSSQH